MKLNEALGLGFVFSGVWIWIMAKVTGVFLLDVVAVPAVIIGLALNVSK